jgi:hypothetical protein
VRGQQRVDLQAISLFENKTGRTAYRMEDVAEWCEAHGTLPMPEAQTPRQLLAKRLAKSASAARVKDADSPIPYRPYHAIRVERNGQIAWDWFNIGNPGVTEEMMSAATHPRHEQALGIGVQVRADWKRFYQTHPTLEPRFPDFDLNWEIDLRHGNQAEGENRKAG